jgi:NADH-quinone oxidoreductase subunit I
VAIDERQSNYEEMRLKKARKLGYGIGLIKGMAVTLKHLFKHNSVIQYPDERQDLSPRTRGVIALKEENCTVCMLCARECPDWCIYIDSHKETLPPKREGGRQRKRNVLDRFAIDYALCMYCGICVEVCPYDALFWSREFEYAESDIRNLTHEKERLSDWMATVLPPPPLEEGALLPGQAEPALPEPAIPAPAPVASADAGAPTRTHTEQATPPPAPDDSGADQSLETASLPGAPSPSESKAPEPVVEKEPEPEPEAPKLSEEQVAQFQESPGPNVEVPHEAPHPVALERTEDPEAVYQQVLQEQLDKGSSPQVAEARAKVARVKAERGIKRGPTPVEVEKPVPSAPTKGRPTEPEPGGAPEAKDIKPDPGPVAPTEEES